MQVIIVGAGPAGAALALMLVRKGIKVKLIEASRDFKRQFRGEGLMPSGLDALEQMDLLPLLLDIPHQTIDGWEFLLSHRNLFTVNEPIEPEGRKCTVVSQPHLLEAMLQEAATYPQFEFFQGEAVRDLLTTENSLSLHHRVSGVKLNSGKEITANLVIAADGRNSILRQKAGINLTKLQNNVDILWFKLDAGGLSASSNTFYSIIQGQDAFGLFRASCGQLQIAWGLHQKNHEHDASQDIKKSIKEEIKSIHWAEKLAATSPPWLAQHILQHRDSLTPPLLLSVIVGRCDRWSIPGLLLLGDAAHPMSPIRAQGINMAFRDAIVAANYLVPRLRYIRDLKDLNSIDQVLPLIQQEREPEIVRIQQLQTQEMGQAELLHHSALVRWGIQTFAPILRPGIKYSWLRRQKQMRQGVTKVTLTI
jgi:2-polyprenyl-6-methoxyphenol hydroxylase-like FAD-dependent oxidoreductase